VHTNLNKNQETKGNKGKLGCFQRFNVVLRLHFVIYQSVTSSIGVRISPYCMRGMYTILTRITCR